MDDDGDRKAFLSRIGTFFVLLGLGLLVLFIASDIGVETFFRYFFLGLLMLGIGFLFKRAGAVPRPPSTRFESLRRMRQKQIESKTKKTNEKPKKS